MPLAQAPRYSANNVKARIDTHLAVQVIAQHEPGSKPRESNARAGGYDSRRPRPGLLVDFRI